MLPSISIIIPFIEDNALLRLAIESCLQVDYPRELLELILVYNGGLQLEFPLELYSKTGSIRLIREDKKGPYSARNAGAKIAKGEMLLFTDSDCVVDKNWAIRLVSPFKDNKISAVFGKVLAYNPVTALESFGNKYIFNHGRMQLVFPWGGNSALRKKVFEELGGFDEDFISGGDMDFGIRLRKQNFYMRYEPEAIVYHKHREALKGIFKQYKKYGSGWLLLREKWGKEIKIYPNWRRVLVSAIYLFFTIFNLVPYIIERRTVGNKGKRFKYLYLAVMNFGLAAGYCQKKNKGYIN